MQDAGGRVARIGKVGRGLVRRRAPAAPVAALGLIVGLLAAVTVLRWFVDGAGQAAALLYVVPIALSALWFGRRAGLVAAGFGITAFVVLELARSWGDVDVTGWVGPVLAMALMGGLVGHLSESAARHEGASSLQARHIEELRDARHAAIEVSDSMVQQVAAARWMVEAGRHKEAIAALDATVAAGIAHVSRTLPPLEHSPE